MTVIDNETTAINTKTAFVLDKLDIIPPSARCRRTERTDLYPELRRFAEVGNIARLVIDENQAERRRYWPRSELVGPAICGNEREQKLIICLFRFCVSQLQPGK